MNATNRRSGAESQVYFLTVAMLVVGVFCWELFMQRERHDERQEDRIAALAAEAETQAIPVEKADTLQDFIKAWDRSLHVEAGDHDRPTEAINPKDDAAVPQPIIPNTRAAIRLKQLARELGHTKIKVSFPKSRHASPPLDIPGHDPMK